MIRFEHLGIYNWENAIRGMRNSWESWDKGDSGETLEPDLSTKFYMGPNDFSLALRLSKGGSDHGKFMRQILVGVDIIAGAEWWKEFDTYKVGTVANSTSMMHKLGSRLLTADDFSFDDPDHPVVLNTLVIVNNVIQRWWAEGKKVGSPTWRLLQKLVPIGFVYRRTVTMSYENLKNMYRSRKGHRLQEWREFCDWIETLPYSQLITLKEADPHAGNRVENRPNGTEGGAARE
jgi:hypothetical protein